MSKLSDHWENRTTKNHRHYASHMPPKKTRDHINRLQEHVINRIDTKKVKTALDWGCGGGVLSKELLKHCDVVILDILQSSLDEAASYINKDVKQILFKDECNIDVDLIVCYSVIQHFPSYHYWKKIAKIWKEMGPKYIAAQIKLNDTVRESSSYYSGRNYLNGLLLNKKEITDSFPKYKLNHWYESTTPASGQKIAFFVLEK